MLLKRLVIVTEGKNTGVRLTKQLGELLGNHVIIDNVLLAQLEDFKDENIDLILYSSSFVKNRSLRYIDERIPSIVARRIIDHKNIKESSV